MSKKCGCDGNCGNACQCNTQDDCKRSKKPENIER